MASTDFVYGAARVLIGEAGADLLTADLCCMLVNANYSPQPNTDVNVSVIDPAAIIIRDIALTGVAFTAAGILYGTVPEFMALAATSVCTAFVLYIKGDSDADSPLIYYSSSGSGFPFLPEGFDYVIGYDQTNGGFFQA